MRTRNAVWAHSACAVTRGARERDRGSPAKYNGTCCLCTNSFSVGQSICHVGDWLALQKAKEETTKSTAQTVAEKAKEMGTVIEAEIVDEVNPPAYAHAAIIPIPAANAANDAITALTRAIMPGLEARLSQIEAVITNPAPVHTIVVDKVKQVEVDVGLTHSAFPKVLRWVGLGYHCWLAGPTGSGKTTLAEQVAKALGREFFYSGALWDSVGLSGYKDVSGNYVRTLFRDAYEKGGLFLLDEVDACDPSVLLWLNGALANGLCAFPDAMVRRHENFICLCAANTYGQGASQEYVGRLKQDNAFLNRFRKIAVDYDAKLERALVNNDSWYNRVIAVRSKVQAKGLRVVISPRNAIAGAKALANSVPQSEVELECLADEMTAEQWASVK